MARFEIPKSVILTCMGATDAMRMFFGYDCSQCLRWLTDRMVHYLRLEIAMANPSLMQYYEAS